MTFPRVWNVAGNTGEHRGGEGQHLQVALGVFTGVWTLAGEEHFRGRVSGASWAPPVSSRGPRELCRSPEWASRGACLSPGRDLPSGAAWALPALLAPGFSACPAHALPRGSASRPATVPTPYSQARCRRGRVSPQPWVPFLQRFRARSPSALSRRHTWHCSRGLLARGLCAASLWPSLACFSYFVERHCDSRVSGHMRRVLRPCLISACVHRTVNLPGAWR